MEEINYLAALQTEFTWYVEQGGYCWLSPEGYYDDVLIACEDSPGRREYHPLEDCTNLFSIFADTETSKEGILAFANEYGPINSLEPDKLGIMMVKSDAEASDFSTRTPRPLSEIDKVLLGGHSFSNWTTGIESMRSLIEVWQAIENNDKDTLSRYITWEKRKPEPYIQENEINESDYYPYGEHERWVIASSLVNRRSDWGIGRDYFIMEGDEIFPRLSENDPRLPAKYLLANLVNRRTLFIHLSLGINDHNQIAPRTVTSDLLDSMYLQLHSWLIGERKFKRCAICTHLADVTENTAKWNYHPVCAANVRAKVQYEKKKAIAVIEKAQHLDPKTKKVTIKKIKDVEGKPEDKDKTLGEIADILGQHGLVVKVRGQKPSKQPAAKKSKSKAAKKPAGKKAARGGK